MPGSIRNLFLFERSGHLSRLSFYAGGEALIRFLVDQDPALSTDLEALFHKMMETG